MTVANEFREIQVEGVGAEFERGARAMLAWIEMRAGDGLRDVFTDERDGLIDERGRLDRAGER